MATTATTAEPPAPMSESQRALVAEEDAMRQVFAESPQDPRLRDPHLLLHKVYDAQVEPTYAYVREDEDEARVPKLLTYARDVGRVGSAIVPKSTFESRLREFTQDCFLGLDWSHVFMAGGAVLGALQNSGDEAGYKGSDIDLFVHSVASEAEASAVLKHVYETVLKNTKGRGDVVRSHRALTILCAYPYRHVQVVLRLYQSPAEVLLGFDIDACCVGYDGQDVWAMSRFRRALTRRYNLVNVSRRSLTYEQRLAKYAKRGFAVAVPGLDKARVNAALFTRRPHELQGLAKLLLYDFLHHAAAQGGQGAARGRARAQAASDEDTGSDYNGDVTLPWGPQWQNEAIINLVHAQHKARFFSQLRRGSGSGATPSAASAATSAPAVAAPKGSFEHVLTADASELRASDFSAWQRSLDKKRVTQPLTWIKDSPAYQDYDNGFRRLMTGSFEPVVDANWEKDAYAASQEARADPRLLSRNDDSAATASAASLTTLSNAASSSSRGQLGFAALPLAPMASFGAQNKALKAQKKTKAQKAVKMPAAKKSSPKKALDEEDEDDEEDEEDDEGSMSDDEDEEEEERPKKKKTPAPTKSKATAKKSVTFGVTSSSGAPMAAPSAYSTSVTSGGFASASVTPSAFGGATGSLSVWSTAPAPQALPQPSSPPASRTAGGFASSAAPSLSAFGGPSLATPAQNTPQRSNTSTNANANANAYTLSNFGGYSNVIDTPSKGVASLGPQPGASFGFATAAQPQPFGFSHQQQPQQLQPQSQLQAPSHTSTSSSGAFASVTSRALLLVALFAKQGKLSAQEKGALKERALRQDPLLHAALEVFELDQDLDELCDTLRRIAAL